ncbi:hypothetical protein F1B92_00775 [Campylobacter sp. FMV-PI01]|uniref:Lipoprotein n=1 Tax=Campylobacter portucalensis TaxID=2608384 RepID=A0A6L5WJ45_9BACT|nr:hypothetical protein [Campylobacter portucalensis]MSN95741.1 hypothetical protein [Campylobacter portucalensis]
MRAKNIFFLIFIGIFFVSCAKTGLNRSKSAIFTIKSPLIKINDAGFIDFGKKKIRLQIYNSGVGLFEMDIKDKICYNGICEDEIKFNEKFFKFKHYRGFFKDILAKKPIYNAKNLIKTECGFRQEVINLQYEICNKKISFNDKKNEIKIIIKEMD